MISFKKNESNYIPLESIIFLNINKNFKIISISSLQIYFIFHINLRKQSLPNFNHKTKP